MLDRVIRGKPIYSSIGSNPVPPTRVTGVCWRCLDLRSANQLSPPANVHDPPSRHVHEPPSRLTTAPPFFPGRNVLCFHHCLARNTDTSLSPRQKNSRRPSQSNYVSTFGETARRLSLLGKTLPSPSRISPLQLYTEGSCSAVLHSIDFSCSFSSHLTRTLESFSPGALVPSVRVPPVCRTTRKSHASAPLFPSLFYLLYVLNYSAALHPNQALPVFCLAGQRHQQARTVFISLHMIRRPITRSAY